jgi:hypothetical protein
MQRPDDVRQIGHDAGANKESVKDGRWIDTAT